MSDQDTPTPPPGAPPEPPAPPPPAAPPPPEPESSGSGGASENRTLMIVLAYLWILALIPLLVEKDDAEVQWHAKNGLILAVAELALWVVIMVLNAVSGFLGCILAPLYFLIWLGILGLHIYCIFKGTKGERVVIPGLSQYVDRF